jgi:aminoglycoside phosphotransferase family enzyme
MVSINIREKIAFLSRAEAYPGRTRKVERIETHMSWVFLTDFHAWKLKKPVRHDYLDFTTPEARRMNSEQEVILNRRLASGVYLAVVPITVDRLGNLQLGGSGDPIDWLVQMRRLPSDRMLDAAIVSHTWNDDDLENVGGLLARFYKTSPPALMTAPEYRGRLRNDLLSAQVDLMQSQYALPSDLVRLVVAGQLEFLDRHPDLLDERVRKGRVIEAHGDLRAEHVCLERQPVIIDCLEFNRSLRILDAVSELSFFALDCERLGAPQVGQRVLDVYRLETGDRPANSLLQFYRSYHACLRAKIAVWHLRDAGANTSKWIGRAKEYLQLVATVGTAL